MEGGREGGRAKGRVIQNGCHTSPAASVSRIFVPLFVHYISLATYFKFEKFDNVFTLLIVFCLQWTPVVKRMAATLTSPRPLEGKYHITLISTTSLMLLSFFKVFKLSQTKKRYIVIFLSRDIIMVVMK